MCSSSSCPRTYPEEATILLPMLLQSSLSVVGDDAAELSFGSFQIDRPQVRLHEYQGMKCASAPVTDHTIPFSSDVHRFASAHSTPLQHVCNSTNLHFAREFCWVGLGLCIVESQRNCVPIGEGCLFWRPKCVERRIGGSGVGGGGEQSFSGEVFCESHKINQSIGLPLTHLHVSQIGPIMQPHR